MSVRIRTAKAKLLLACFALLAFFLAAHPASAQTTLTAFTLTTAPTGSVPGGVSLQITPLLTGTPGSAPSGSVDAFSSSSATCSTKSTDFGTQLLTVNNPATQGGNYTSSTTFSVYPVPVGTYYVCATYIPDTNSTFNGATTNPGVPITAYAPTKLSVLQQNYPLAGQPITLSISLSTPPGQPAPTGLIVIQNSSGVPIAQTTASATGISPDPVTVTLPSPSYSVIYEGDSVYNSQTYYGTAFYSNQLVSISPPAVQAGSPNTTLTVNGNGFVSGPTGSTGSTGSSIQVTDSTGASQVLTTTYVSSNQLTAVVPQALLASPQVATVNVVNVYGTSNPADLNIYAQQGTSTAVSNTTPTSFTYGQMSTNTVQLAATVSPTANPIIGIPAGVLNFTLTGPGASNTQLALGSATLSSSNGAGSFVTGAVDTPTDVPPARALTADLNGDGATDVVSLPSLAGGDYALPELQVFLATKVNSFQTEQLVPTNCSPSDFAVGDLNGDGKPDLVALCATGNGGTVATYMLGNGDGTFQAPVPFLGATTLTNPGHIVIGDFNGDGVMDVALLDPTNGQIQVFTGSKTFGTFTPLPASTFPADIVGSTPASVADFNHDGKSDIVFASLPYQGQPAILQLLTSNGDGTFAVQNRSFTTPAYFLGGPVITDVNYDSYPDVAIADPGSSASGTDTGQVLVFVNNGSGTLNAPLTYPIPNASMITGLPYPAIGIGPSTATQPKDIFVGAVNSTTNAISVTALIVSGGALTLNQAGISGGYDATASGGNNLLVSGDFNGDGYDDLGIISDPTATGLPTALMPWFYSNTSTALLNGSLQQPNAGTYNLTAAYNGNALFSASTSPNYAITITQAKPTGSLQVPSPVTYGQSVTFTANITGVPNGTIPSGTVTFTVNGANYTATLAPGSGATTATAQYTLNTLNTLPPSSTAYTVTASYSGDNNYSSLSLGPSSLAVVNSLTLNLTSSATTTTTGTVVTFTVTGTTSATSLLAGQQVTIQGLPGAGDTATFDASGKAVLSYGLFSPGSYSLTANFAGNANFASAASNAVALTVNKAPAQLSVVSSANPVTYPTPVNLTATAGTGGRGLLTGTVSFADNGAALGNGTLTLVNGSGGLSQVSTTDTSTNSIVAEAVGDFNKDGYPDLAVLQSTATGTVLLVSLGNGNGTFQAPTSYTVPSYSNVITVGDFNGDRYPDIAITNSANTVYIYLNNGASGGFTLNQTLPALAISDSAYNLGMATGDFNKDGKTDLAVLSSNYVAVYLNTGGTATTGPTQYFSTPTAYAVDLTADYTGITVADFNKDNYPDIALSDYTGQLNNLGNLMLVLTNKGTAGPGFTQATYPLDGDASSGITSGDFNGDGYPDIAVADTGFSGYDSMVEVFLNNKTGNFPTDSAYANVVNPQAITSADFNKDGYDDIAVIGRPSQSPSGVAVLYGSATGAMTTTADLPAITTSLNGYPNGNILTAADLNGDGNPDLLAVQEGVSTNNQVVSLLDQSTQTTLSNVVLPAGTDPLTATYTPDATSSPTYATGTSPALNQVVNQATPIVTWTAPAPIVYGTPLSSTQLNATASVPGTFTYTPAAGTILPGGTQTLTVVFQPTSSNYAPVTSTVTINVTQATPTITWPAPAPIYYGMPLTSTQLNATASTPGTFAYTPSAGTVLSLGQHTLSVLFTPTSTADYTTATASVTITVQPGDILTSITPSSGNLGDPATTITLAGAGFLSTSVAQLNGTALSTTYVGPTTLKAVIPASFFTTVQTGSITVTTPGEPLSAAQSYSVVAPAAQATLTGPSTAPPATQPTITLQLSKPYPVPVTATFTLAVEPGGKSGLIDPAVQFSTGGSTYTVTIPANSTAPVPVQLQTGTLPAFIYVSATLSAGGTDITPSNLQQVVIQVPTSAPVLTSVKLVRSGNTITITVQGFSNTREVQSAYFHFTPVSGSQLANADVTVQLNSAFSNWYSQTASDQYGSAFSYTQSFTLSQSASSIASVSVTLTNSVGTSNIESAQ